MRETITVNVRVSGELGRHVAGQVGEDGLYENVSEYIRDLIRRDLNGRRRAFAELKAQLAEAYGQMEGAGQPVDVDDFLAEARARRSA